ncbi:MAG: DUF2867 domain-containing protein [Parasphingorhabdus sp.]
MTVRKRAIPLDSMIGQYLPDADFGDAYGVSVPSSDQSPEDSFHAIMSSMPDWFRRLFKLRNKLVRPFGLVAPRSSEVDRMMPKQGYQPGDRIGVFEFYGRTGNEVITGADDKHLDFRLSVLRIPGPGVDEVIVSTLVKRHNFAGRAYLRSILPFHELGIRSLLRNAAETAKL